MITLFAPLPYYLLAEQSRVVINEETGLDGKFVGNVPENQEQEGYLEEQVAGGDNPDANWPGDGEVEDQPEIGEVALNFLYPDAVRGIYVTGNTVGVARFNRLLELVNSTDLNSMVIDIKEDLGYVTYRLKDTAFDDISKNYIKDPHTMMETLAENNIYPIARIVVFKDTVLANKKPEYSFLSNGAVWKNNRNEAFVSPFLPEVWEYNVAIAKKAAELGFPEVQFDYVRFPEGFEKRDRSLSYSMGNYSEEKLTERILREWEAQPVETRPLEPPAYSMGLARVMAVTDFVAFAKKELEPYGVLVSVDIFGYSATIPAATGIGQNFLEISKHVDVISSMIYPSHWGLGYFGIAKPDTEPYRVIQEYMKAENELLGQLENPPVSRPWIQDFTASWLGAGNFIKYGKAEVDAQIRALHEAGIKEYLIWNASNSYTPNINHKP
ncbi:MAG: putative glycoside hydrolase [Clostridia bacterium]|nr:putative glycoside hydrolase [Clostridia bacterium]